IGASLTGGPALRKASRRNVRGQIFMTYPGLKFSISGPISSVRVLLKILDGKLQLNELSLMEFESARYQFLDQIHGLESRSMDGLTHTRAMELYFEKHYTVGQLESAIDNLNRTQFNEELPGLFTKGRIKAFTYGNVTPDTAHALVKQVTSNFSFDVVSKDKVFRLSKLQFPTGKRIVIGDTAPSRYSGLRETHCFDNHTTRNRMAVVLIEQLVKEDFPRYLVNQKQVGDNAAAGYWNTKSNPACLVFTTRSENHHPRKISNLVNQYIQSQIARVQSMSDTEFRVIKATAKQLVGQKPQSFEGRANQLSSVLFQFRGQFNRTKRSLSVLDSMSKNDLVNFIRILKDPGQANIFEIRAYGRHQPNYGKNIEFITPNRLPRWKQRQPYGE
ncbi:MAG: hypothetical protein ABEJ65_02295, partial [bacterium]